jgi:hypothetical protein
MEVLRQGEILQSLRGFFCKIDNLTKILDHISLLSLKKDDFLTKFFIFVTYLSFITLNISFLTVPYLTLRYLTYLYYTGYGKDVFGWSVTEHCSL